jgi:hypothetical protein
MSPIETFDAEIALLQAEIATVERAPPSIAERFAAAEAELRADEALYRAHGLKVGAGHPGETAHLRQRARIGLCMVVGADKILKVERERIEQQGEGLSPSDKQRRLDQLRDQILKVAARRELLVRDEADDLMVVRPVHPELVVFPRAEVQRIAAAR